MYYFFSRDWCLDRSLSPVFAKEPKIRAVSQSASLMMSASHSLFGVEQDSSVKKMFSGRHELGVVIPDQKPAKCWPPCSHASS